MENLLTLEKWAEYSTESREIAEKKSNYWAPLSRPSISGLAPATTLMRFYFVLTKKKKNILDLTSVFVLFSSVPTTSPSSYENAYFPICFPLSSTLKRGTTLMDTTVYDSFFGTVFKSLRLSTLEAERFRNDAFSKGYTSETISESLRFHQRFLSE